MDFHDPFASASHLAFAGFMLFAGLVLLRLTRRHAPFRRWAVGLYALSAVLLYTASGLFHGVSHPSADSYALFLRFDLTGIFLLVAGSILPAFGYLLSGPWRVAMTGTVGGLAFLGIVMVWAVAPSSSVMVPVCVALAAVGMVPLPLYVRAVGWRGVGWMLATGLVYAAGGVCEVLKWPTPWPGVIGSHEVLHVLDIAATLVHLGLLIWLVRRVGVNLDRGNPLLPVPPPAGCER